MTPFIVGIGGTTSAASSTENACTESEVAKQLDLVGEQLVAFAALRLRAPTATFTGQNDEVPPLS